MLSPELANAQLYDGTGAHLGGFFPPLAIDNCLTATHEWEVAARLGQVHMVSNAETSELALVWLVPMATVPSGPFQREVVGALVAALDTGNAVLIHAPTQAVADAIAAVVWAFVGGGHA